MSFESMLSKISETSVVACATDVTSSSACQHMPNGQLQAPSRALVVDIIGSGGLAVAVAVAVAVPPVDNNAYADEFTCSEKAIQSHHKGEPPNPLFPQMPALRALAV
jgi:hypothetical protein